MIWDATASKTSSSTRRCGVRTITAIAGGTQLWRKPGIHGQRRRADPAGARRGGAGEEGDVTCPVCSGIGGWHEVRPCLPLDRFAAEFPTDNPARLRVWMRCPECSVQQRLDDGQPHLMPRQDDDDA